MRNIFDQYEQPENRLTHALVSTLHNDRALIRPFLRFLGAKRIPPLKYIHLGEQESPGGEADYQKDGKEGLPDACFYDDDSWAVLVECKVQAGVSGRQLARHHKTAQRFGYDEPQLALIAVDVPGKRLPPGVTVRQWRDVYQWFRKRNGRSWARDFAGYMHVFESKMIAQKYDIRGTQTMFDGFRFNEQEPYTYREGKRLMRLLRQEFAKRRRLINDLGMDPNAKGRTALTRDRDGGVWDFMSLEVARDSVFTAYPHLTMVVRPTEAVTAMTVPNGLRGGIKNKLKHQGKEEFGRLLAVIEKRVRPVLRKAPGAQPMIYAHQRHYRSQKSRPVHDGRLEVDLRTLVPGDRSLRHQPMWLEALYELLTNKRTNIQMGIEVHLPYTAKVMRSPGALDVMVEAWVAMKPLLDFVLARPR